MKLNWIGTIDIGIVEEEFLLQRHHFAIFDTLFMQRLTSIRPFLCVCDKKLKINSFDFESFFSPLCINENSSGFLIPN